MASLGSAPGIMVGIGVGTAAAAAIEPIVEPGRQAAWAAAPNRILDPSLYAQLVAQGAIDLVAVGQPLAKRNGLNADQFNRLVYLAQRAPDLAITLELWRRGLFGDPTSKTAQAFVTHALSKEQIETQYWPGIMELFSERLDPALIATMVQRSILPNVTDPVTGEQILPGQPSTAGSNVPAMPQVDLNPILEARAHGIDFPRLAAEARIVGLPASLDLAARMHFREIITEGAYNQAVLEGNTRGEWAPFLLEGFREIPSATNFVEGRLRGWIDDDHMNKGTARHGMSEADTHLLFQIHGRPLTWHQVFIGLRRGGEYDGPIDMIHPAFLHSLRQSDLRPEWYNLAWHSRFNYPAPFVLRSLTEGGDITEAQAHEILIFEGWEPTLAASVAAKWAAKHSTAKGNPWIAKAEQQWWTAAHKAFVKGGELRSIIEPIMLTFVPDLADRDAIFQWWTDERTVNASSAAAP